MSLKIKKLLKELFIGAIILFMLTNVISYLRKPTLDSTHLPKIEAKLVNGSKVQIEEGKALVIHFWATWCPTCKLEASNIQKLSESYEVLTIAVNSGEDAVLEAYLKERDLSFKVINDRTGMWAEQFKVEAFPTTFMYDSKGELKFTEVGYTTTAGLLARLKLIE